MRKFFLLNAEMMRVKERLHNLHGDVVGYPPPNDITHKKYILYIDFQRLYAKYVHPSHF